MDPFQHTVQLIRLAARPSGYFAHPISLNSLPRRTYVEGKLYQVNGRFVSAYLRQKHNQE